MHIGSGSCADSLPSQLCGGAPVDEALLAIGMQPGQAADAAGRALAGLGLQTALDLRLVLGDGPDAHELMSDLQAAGLSLGDRSKIRLLVGDDRTAEQTGGHSSGRASNDAFSTVSIASADHSRRFAAASSPQRRLQADAADKAKDSGGMSTDTLAIMLTVMVGAVGYVMQGYLAQRAERVAAEQV